METIIGAKGADLKRRPDMTDFTHKRAFMDGVKTGREQNSAERKILLERISKLEEQLAAEKLAAGYWMEQSCRDHNRAERAEQQMSTVNSVITPKICSLPPLPDPRAKCVEGHDGGFSTVQMYEFAYTAAAIRDAELTDWITKYIIPNHPEAVEAIKSILFRLE